MTYYIFTDSASNSRGASCAFYIRTATTYICSDCKMFDRYKISTGETLAIGIGLANLYKRVELNSNDVVVILTDSQSAIDYYTKFIKTGEIPTNDKKLIACLSLLHSMALECTVAFCKVDAHKDELTENTYVDRRAKLTLREQAS